MRAFVTEDRKIRVEWSPVPSASRYNLSLVRRNDGHAEFHKDINNTSYEFSFQHESVDMYYCKVVALDDDLKEISGSHRESKISQRKPGLKKMQPKTAGGKAAGEDSTTLSEVADSVNAVFDNGQIKVDWKAQVGAVNYTVVLRNADNQRQISQEITSKLSHVFPPEVSDGTTYYCTVSPLDNDDKEIGRRKASNNISTALTADPEISIKYQDEQLHVTWLLDSTFEAFDVKLYNTAKEWQTRKKVVEQKSFAVFKPIDGNGIYYCTVTPTADGKSVGQTYNSEYVHVSTEQKDTEGIQTDTDAVTNRHETEENVASEDQGIPHKDSETDTKKNTQQKDWRDISELPLNNPDKETRQNIGDDDDNTDGETQRESEVDTSILFDPTFSKALSTNSSLPIDNSDKDTEQNLVNDDNNANRLQTKENDSDRSIPPVVKTGQNSGNASLAASNDETVPKNLDKAISSPNETQTEILGTNEPSQNKEQSLVEKSRDGAFHNTSCETQESDVQPRHLDSSPQNISSNQDDKNPFQVSVTWECPEMNVSGYEFIAYKGPEEVCRNKTDESSITFLVPKLDAQYGCAVTSILNADEIGKSSTFDISCNGKATEPTNVEIKKNESNPFQVRLMWEEPFIKPEKYKVIIYNQMASFTKEYLPIKPEVQFENLALSMTYQCKIIGIYGGKEGRAKHCTFDTISGNETIVSEVKAAVHPNDPFSIDLTWKSPERKPKEYLVEIFENGNQLFLSKKEKTPSTTKTVLSIPKMKIGKEYDFIVKAKYDKHVGLPCQKVTYKTPTRDDMRVRDIETNFVSNNPFEIGVKWTEPKFKCLRYRVGIFNDEDNKLVSEPKTETKPSTVFRILDLNKLCHITVNCLYAGGETGPSESSTINPSSSDTCKKTIPKLGEPTIKADDPFEIKIQWQEPILSPKKYLIQTIKNGDLLKDKEPLYMKKKLEIDFPITEIGSTYQFLVSGIFEKDCRGISAISEELNTAEYDFTSVQNLQVNRDKRNPFHIAVRWDPPKCPPISYTIMPHKDDVLMKPLKEKQECEALFSNLEEKTTYWYSVVGIYKNKKRGSESKSNSVTTANKMDTAPTNIEAIVSNKNPFQVRVRWKPPIIKPPNYKVCIFCGKTNIKSLETEINEAVFEGLKQNTEYSCTVVGIFEGFKNDFIINGKSNTVTTGNDEMLAPTGLRFIPSNREVTITWALPDNHCHLLEYICQLQEEEEPFDTKTVRINSVSFSELRNEHNYRCKITAVYRNAHKAHTTSDHIRINSKPINISCKSSATDNTLLLLVKWENEDIGQEAVNFKKMKSTIKLQMQDSDKVVTANDNWVLQDSLEVEYSITKCSFPNLVYGKEYRVQISTRYMDLDSKEELVAASWKPFSTGIDTAKNLEIEWKNNQIMAKWEEAQGAKSYELRILDCKTRKEYFSVTPTTNSWTFNMTATCGYGQNRIFQLIGKCRDIASVPVEKELLIGGNYVPTNVELKPSPDDTKRQLSASWTAPVEKPSKYYIEITKDNQSVNKLETKETTCTFTDLLPGSVYSYNISAFYTNVDGTGSVWSNKCSTTMKSYTREEKNPTFGSPGEIRHEIFKDENSHYLKLSWNNLNSTENYTFKGFEIKVFDTAKKCIHFENKQSNPEAKIKRLESGSKYKIEVFAAMMEKDSKNEKGITSTKNIYTKPEVPEIDPCTWEQGIVTFSWNDVKGAKYYSICIMDEHLEENIILDTKVERKSAYKAEMMGELRMGKSCMMKVTVHDESGQSVNTDWTPQRIGDPKAPRNIKATKNRHISGRCIDIKFDHPIYDKSPSKYRVEAIPNTGRIKAMKFSSLDQIIFTHLRKKSEYTFAMYAVYDGEESDGSLSNIVSISGESQDDFSTMKFNKMQGGNFKIGTVHAPGEVNVTHNHPDGPFGIPLKTKSEIVTSQEKCEECKISWQPPSFNKRRNDFKIYHFNILLERKDGCVVHDKKPFSENVMTYNITLTLERGWEYAASISTVFEDIDRDEDYISEPATLSIYTHPEKAELQQNFWEDTKLILKWNIARGAQEYRVIICDENNKCLRDSPFLTDTDYSWKADDSFFGNAYKVIIHAIGKNNMETEYESELTIIGGDKVPKQVTAKLAKDSESYKQAEIHWEEPTIKPKSYVIVAEPENGKKLESEPINGKSYLFDGLMAGSKYVFKVFAVDENSKRSLGSSSGTIETKPDPNMVKGVKTSMNTDQGFCVSWNKMEMIEALGQIEYELKITTQKPFMEIKQKTTDTQYCISGLSPGKKYTVEVRAINKEGRGEYSTKYMTMTEYGKPSNIKMKLSEPPASAIEIKFVQAPNEPSDYNIQLIEVKQNTEMTVLDGLLFNNSLEEPKKQGPYINNQNADGQWQIFVVSGLQPNTQYKTAIQAQYESDTGKKVCTKSAVLTASAKPAKPNVELCKDEYGYSCRDVYIDFGNHGDCMRHQISVKTSHDVIESQVTVDKLKIYKYSCEHEAGQYFFQIRCQNLSEQFSDLSDKTLLQLAPLPVTGLKSETDREDVKIIWDEPTRQVSQFVITAQLKEESHSADNKLSFTVQDQSFASFPQHFPAAEYTVSVHAEVQLAQSKNIAGKYVTLQDVISEPAKPQPPQLIPNGTKISMNFRNYNYLCDEREVEVSNEEQQSTFVRLKADQTVYIHDNNLSAGMKYFVRVRNIYKNVEGDWSVPWTVLLAPGRVQNIKVEIVEFKMGVKWDKLHVKNIKYKATILDEGNQEIDFYSGPATSWNSEKHLVPGKKYYCKVLAFNFTGEGPSEASVKLRTSWNRPTEIEVTKDDKQPSKSVKLAWENPDGVNCFKLKIDNQDILLTENWYYFEHGKPGHTHTAQLFCGFDNKYDNKCISKRFTMNPPPPRNVEVFLETGDNCELAIALDTTDTAHCKYEICVYELPQTQSPVMIVSDVTSQCTVIGGDLIHGQEYVVGVKSFDEIEGVKQYSTERHSKPILTYPGKVQALKAVHVSTTTIRIEWDILNGAEYYRVHWNEQTAEMNYNYFFIKDLQPSTEYSISIRAVNQSGPGVYSDNIVVKTYPPPPKNVEVFPKAGGKCELTVALDTTDTAHCKYEICVYELPQRQNSVMIVSDVTSQCTVIGGDLLTHGREYVVGVKSFDEIEGEKHYSIERLSKPALTYPGKVQSLKAVQISTTTIRIEWDILNEAEYYRVHWNQQTAEIKTNYFSIEDLQPSTEYSIWVRAVNQSGPGVYSDDIVVKTIPPSPQGVKTVSHENHPGKIRVEIKDENQKSIEHEITLFRYVGEDKKELVRANSKSRQHIFAGAVPGRKYCVSVRAKDIFDNLSEEVTSNTVITEFPAPRNVKVFRNPANVKTSLIVSFNDEDNPLKTYLIKVACGIKDEHIDPIETKKKTAIIEGLTPGGNYLVTVQTKIDKLESKVVQATPG
ncbi:uncharacterized protein LOC144422932 isoform X2 [Styela clava]